VKVIGQEGGEVRRRILLVLTVALVLAAMMVATAAPAFADAGGVPHEGSEGKGKLCAPGQIKKSEIIPKLCFTDVDPV
jgi:hypothetical protein